MDKVACELVEVERDVLHFLTFRSQGYFKKEHVGEKKISSQGLPILVTVACLAGFRLVGICRPFSTLRRMRPDSAAVNASVAPDNAAADASVAPCTAAADASAAPCITDASQMSIASNLGRLLFCRVRVYHPRSGAPLISCTRSALPGSSATG